MSTLVVTAIFGIAVFLAGARLIRFVRLGPAALIFSDRASLEAWRELSSRAPVLIFTERLEDAVSRHLSPGGETAEDQAPRVFVHFEFDRGATMPAIRLHDWGPGYVMEVVYADRLAAVVLAIIDELRPLCALCLGHRRREHPLGLWLRLLWKLDGPPWFVLRSIMARRTRIQGAQSGGTAAEAGETAHARS